MPGNLVSDHCNFSYHRSNAATSAFLIHQHDCYELYYYISGDLRFLYDGTEYAPAPHTMFLVVPGVLHGIHVLSDTTYERYTFHFTPRFRYSLTSNDSMITDARRSWVFGSL